MPAAGAEALAASEESGAVDQAEVVVVVEAAEAEARVAPQVAGNSERPEASATALR